MTFMPQRHDMIIALDASPAVHPYSSEVLQRCRAQAGSLPSAAASLRLDRAVSARLLPLCKQ
jgi:hypothetical protein